MNTNRTTLILGANGKTGRRVADRLTARGVPVRRGSRAGSPRFDWLERSTWAPAVRGVSSVYVVYAPDLAFTGAAESVRDFSELALTQGARRLVLLSGRGEEGAQRGERFVQESGADWTIVRSSFFAQNFSEGLFVESVLSGVIAVPAGDVVEPYIDVDDVADVAVEALTDDRHIGEVYDVTGPRLMTLHDVAVEIAKAADRDVEYVPITDDEFTAALCDAGMPTEEALGLTELFATLFDGRNAHLDDGVQQALGRPPRDFSDYAREAAATGVWRAR